MRKIEECRLIIKWNDGQEQDISWHIPEGLIEHIDDYLDMLEKEANEEELA